MKPLPALNSKDSEESPESTTSLSPLTFLTPLVPERFPTLQDLAYAELQSLESAAKPRSGLFQQLLGGRVEHLHHDATEHPNKYDAESVRLFADLVGGRRLFKDLKEEDLARLDHATVDFATAPAPKPAVKKPPAAPRRETAESGPVLGLDVPAGDVRPFWWL